MLTFDICFAQGYDMEDAMVINKASLERGFAHGSVYKCETVELNVIFKKIYLTNY